MPKKTLVHLPNIKITYDKNSDKRNLALLKKTLNKYKKDDKNKNN
ncbi:MAG: hypothetical protein ACOCUI_02880 [bacterium]